MARELPRCSRGAASIAAAAVFQPGRRSVPSVVWLREPTERCESTGAVAAPGFLPGWDETLFIARKHSQIWIIFSLS